MIERGLTDRIIRSIRRQLPGAVVLKHCDLATAGIPDLSVSHAGRTTWYEVKLFPAINPPTTLVRKKLEPLQLASLLLLERATRAWYLVGFTTKAGTRLLRLTPTQVDGIRAAGAFPGDWMLPDFNETMDAVIRGLR